HREVSADRYCLLTNDHPVEGEKRFPSHSMDQIAENALAACRLAARRSVREWKLTQTRQKLKVQLPFERFSFSYFSFWVAYCKSHFFLLPLASSLDDVQDIQQIFLDNVFRGSRLACRTPQVGIVVIGHDHDLRFGVGGGDLPGRGDAVYA